MPLVTDELRTASLLRYTCETKSSDVMRHIPDEPAKQPAVGNATAHTLRQ